MRQVILDTETTGLAADQGHRIIEIGCLEVVNRRLSGRTLHVYLDPEREIDEAATEVHGMTWDDLRGKPRFGDVAQRLLDFVADAEVLIHNAAFDLSFLDAELERVGQGRFRAACRGVLDTLHMARELHPGKRNSLDALCDRLGVDNSARTLHGALLDAELLADVYVNMTRGQEALLVESSTPLVDPTGPSSVDLRRLVLPVLTANAQELEAHADVLRQLDKASGGKTVWQAVGV